MELFSVMKFYIEVSSNQKHLRTGWGSSKSKVVTARILDIHLICWFPYNFWRWFRVEGKEVSFIVTEIQITIIFNIIITIPFVLMLNAHFLNYYVPSRTYVRKPSSNHFNSTLPHIPAQYYSGSPQNFREQENRTMGKAQLSSARYAPQPYHPCDIFHPHHLPLIHLQGNIHAVPRHSMSLYVARVIFTLRLVKYFLCALILLLFFYCRGLSQSSHPLDLVTLPIYYINYQGTMRYLVTLKMATSDRRRQYDSIK